MKIAIAMTLMLQVGLIGLSAAMIARPDTTSVLVGVHSTLIAINLLFGAVNVRGLMR